MIEDIINDAKRQKFPQQPPTQNFGQQNEIQFTRPDTPLKESQKPPTQFDIPHMPSQALKSKIQQEIKRDKIQQQDDDQKLVDLLTDQVLAKMMLNQSGMSEGEGGGSSNQMVVKLIRELEQKGVSKDYLHAQLQEQLGGMVQSMQNKFSPKNKKSSPFKNRQSHLNQELQQQQYEEEDKNQQQHSMQQKQYDKLIKEKIHQRRKQPRIDLDFENEKLKLEAEQELLHRQMPINAAPYVANASNIGMSPYQNPFYVAAGGGNTAAAAIKPPLTIGPLQQYELSSVDGVSDIWRVQQDESIGDGIRLQNPRTIKARIQSRQQQHQQQQQQQQQQQYQQKIQQNFGTIDTNQRTIQSELNEKQSQKQQNLRQKKGNRESFGPVQKGRQNFKHQYNDVHGRVGSGGGAEYAQDDFESGQFPEHILKHR